MIYILQVIDGSQFDLVVHESAHYSLAEAENYGLVAMKEAVIGNEEYQLSFRFEINSVPIISNKG